MLEDKRSLLKFHTAYCIPNIKLRIGYCPFNNPPDRFLDQIQALLFSAQYLFPSTWDFFSTIFHLYIQKKPSTIHPSVHPSTPGNHPGGGSYGGCMDRHQLDWCERFDRLVAGRNFPGFRRYYPWDKFSTIHVGKYTSTHGWYGVGWSLNVGWDGHTLVLRWMLPL